MALDNLPYLLLVLVALGFGYRSYFAPVDKLLAQLPSAVDHQGFLSSLRNKLSSLGNVNTILETAYNRFSKLNLPFILPGLHHNVIILPPSDVRWLIDQPDHILSAKHEQKESLQTDRTFLDKTIADNPVHEIIIRREMTRQIGTLIPEVEDELAAAITEYFGNDTEEWKEIGVFEAMMKVVSRVSNRVIVGLPLCRNEDYLTNAANFASDISVSSAILRLIPSYIKPLTAWIVLLPNRWHIHKANKYLIPLIKQRMQDPDGKDKSDFLSWSMAEVAAHPEQSERQPWKIARRVMTVNFAAIHTSTFTATNLLLDFFSSPTTTDDVPAIRGEVETIFAESGYKWDKASVAKLVKTDSAMRESMRTSVFSSHGMTRQVLDPNGLYTKSGLHLPFGTKVGTPTYALHHDSDLYEDAGTYKPFRFSKAREQVVAPEEQAGATSGNAEKKSMAKVLESKNLSAVTTSDTFLGFGHGKHACPGRFFATAEIKLLLAYFVMNYDVQPMTTRPANTYFGGIILPPMKATMMFRRRKIAS